MALDRASLLRMTKEELDTLFRSSSAGPVPQGEGKGSALAWPGTLRGRLLARIVSALFWQGKVFDAAKGFLVNLVSPLSLRAIKARVYTDRSWLDGKECIVLDYSKTSRVARMVRDEIREVAPGLYMGPVFCWRRRLFHFAVSFQPEPAPKTGRRILGVAALLLLVLLIWAAARFGRDAPVTHASDADHFKYGSLGGERGSGVPLSIWKLLPVLFADLLPGRGLQSLGFLYEGDNELPIGVSRRNVQGIDRAFLNCAVCHVGSVRDSPESKPVHVLGMPANTVDLQTFQRFLSACAVDERFTPTRLVDEIARLGTDDAINRLLLRFVGVGLIRQRLLTLRDRFSFMDREPDYGPGRVDTFNPPKVLLNFRMDNLPEREWVGICDFPSVWNQRQRKGMQLHWDGNNDSLEERNRSAAFGGGVTPPTLDRAALARTANWLMDAAPPSFRYPIDSELAAKGIPLYRKYCLRCHGVNGTDFEGELVGKVTPIEEVGTDRARLDSYSYELCVNQNHLYAGYETERFKHFRKTHGYANQPLDGIWLRAPYLHNGSVPTLRDLMEPSGRRPVTFYRGYDVYDPRRVGFVSDVAAENGRRFFAFDTRLPGNGNAGHEGREYGTDLSPQEKDAIVEYLKTF